MEKQLFDWEGWDELEVGDLWFHDVTLIRDIGPFKKGDKFLNAGVHFSTGLLQLFNEGNDPVAEFKLSLKVGERVS